MRILRCKDQTSKTLEEFYSALAESDHVVGRAAGKAMLSLIDRLRAVPSQRRVFGLTSHERLCLLADDTYRAPWFVIVSALDERNYVVECLMPSDSAPWPNARIRGEATSEEDALRMVLIAMEKSGGWRYSDDG